MKFLSKYGEVHVLLNCPLLNSTERLEWMTSITEYPNGGEDRFVQRDAPRQILSFEYLSMYKEFGDMFHMLSANMRKMWGIPLYQTKVSIPNLSNENFIQVSTAQTISDLKIGYALIQSDTSNQIVEITQIGQNVIVDDESEYQDGFKIASNISANNAVIIPLRICIIDGDINIKTGGFWSNNAIEFKVIAEDLPEHSGVVPTQYKSEDIYYRPLLLNGNSLEITLSQHQVILDNELGLFSQFTNHVKPKQSKPLRTFLKTLSEYHDFKHFLFRRMGRYRPFWLPLYDRHLNVTNTGNITTSLSVSNKYLAESNRNYIAVKRKNGNWTAHQITSKTASTLTVTPSIASNINNIERIYYMGLYRFDVDHIEFSFIGNGKSQAVVLIKEVDS